ncbi:hypothetical protein [Sporosarcina koreensis]|uniref:Uncharacterized protein n=1 Tax=Sporosarcina koreensis TaxID=334735 RepID=A0ABW0TTT8_9BACL
MRPIELCKDGYKMREIRDNVNSLAIISLRTALKAYYSTYSSIKNTGGWNESDETGRIDDDFNLKYIESYAETIVHFQHFFELILKDILRKKNELLALRIETQHEVFANLVLGNEIEQSKIDNIKTVEFDTAFKRVQKIIESNEIGGEYSFLTESNNIEALNQLNIMRNRIWHRGSYVLRYKSLDLFIGRYIFPILEQLMCLEGYDEIESWWKGRKNRLNIDPIKEIIKENREINPSFDKIAFLKEFGRANYNNPLGYGFGIFENDIKDQAKRIAEGAHGVVIHNCPVCGVDSLVGYEDTEVDYEEDGEVVDAWRFIYQVKCHCCHFEMRNLGMRNLEEYGYDEPDYWQVEKLFGESD